MKTKTEIRKADQVLNDLRKEINGMLIFFCQVDLNIHGYITGDTVHTFEVQGVVFPEELKELTYPNHKCLLNHLSN